MDELYRDSMLPLLEGFTLDNPENIAKEIADEFRQRRIEKNLTREAVAERSGVAPANIARFEQKGLISLVNLIKLAMAMKYTSEIRHLFSRPKYSTIAEANQIRRNQGKKKAYNPRKHDKD